MQPDAIRRQLRPETSPDAVALSRDADRLVGNEPGIAAAAPIASARVAPARDVALVRVRNAEREPIDRRATFGREMKNVFVAIIQKTRRTDRLEMSARNQFALLVFDRDRLDPMDRILQNEEIAQAQNELVRQQRIRRRRAEIEKKRAVRFQEPRGSAPPIRGTSRDNRRDLRDPNICRSDAEIVRRRGDDEID